MLLLKNRKSRSARLLAKALGVKCITASTLNHKHYRKLILNWGVSFASFQKNTTVRLPMGTSVINKSESVVIASNKLLTFELLSSAPEVTLPEYSTDSNEVKDNLSSNLWGKVVCRTTLTGHSGAGIVIARSPMEVVDAPLYTNYIKKGDEYRVHIVGDDLLIQKKKKLSPESLEKKGITNVNSLVRNLDNGWVYSTNFEISDNIKYLLGDMAIRSISALGLDFGAVDIIVEKDTNALVVLEVNTAPGLSDVTLPFYVKAMQYMVNKVYLESKSTFNGGN